MTPPQLGPSAETRLPEFDLLCCCSRTQLGPEHPRRVRALLQGDVDWGLLISLATRHRVLPLFYRQLKAAFPGSIPREFEDRLGLDALNNDRRSLFLAGELLRVMRLFEARGDPRHPLQGPDHGQVGVWRHRIRQFRDLDIWVSEEHKRAARGIMLRDGYLEMESARDHHFEMIKYYGLNWFEANWLYALEIHWRFNSSRVALRPSGAGARRPRDGPGPRSNLKTFNYTNLLILSCLHGTRHLWDRLQMVCDVSEIINSGLVDWGLALARPGASTSSALLLGLRLANDLLGSPLPPQAEQRIRADVMVGASRRGQGPPPARPRWPRGEDREASFYINSFERRRDRLACRARHVRFFLENALRPAGRTRASCRCRSACPSCTIRSPRRLLVKAFGDPKSPSLSLLKMLNI